MRMAAGEAVDAGHYVVSGSFIARESCGCAVKPLGQEVSSDQRHDDPIIAFTAALARAVRRGPTGPGFEFPVERVNRLTNVMEATMRQAVYRGADTAGPRPAEPASRELYTLGRNQATSDAILHFTAQLSARLTTESGAPTATVVTALNHCVTEVQLGLAKALLNERNEAYYDLRKAIRDEHEISLDLLRSHESDPGAGLVGPDQGRGRDAGDVEARCAGRRWGQRRRTGAQPQGPGPAQDGH